MGAVIYNAMKQILLEPAEVHRLRAQDLLCDGELEAERQQRHFAFSGWHRHQKNIFVVGTPLVPLPVLPSLPPSHSSSLLHENSARGLILPVTFPLPLGRWQKAEP